MAIQWFLAAEYAKSPSSKVKPKFTTCSRFPILVPSPVNFTLIFLFAMKSADGDHLSNYKMNAYRVYKGRYSSSNKTYLQ